MTGGVGEVSIRAMTRGDLNRVIAIAASLKDAPQWPTKVYEVAVDSQAQPHRIALAAHSAKAGIIGFAVVLVIPPQAELESIAVMIEAQQQGVARRLLAQLSEKLKSRQVTEVHLEVRGSNMPARSFYRAVGFAETGHRPRYYVDPEEDAVLLRKCLG